MAKPLDDYAARRRSAKAAMAKAYPGVDDAWKGSADRFGMRDATVGRAMAAAKRAACA